MPARRVEENWEVIDWIAEVGERLRGFLVRGTLPLGHRSSVRSSLVANPKTGPR